MFDDLNSVILEGTVNDLAHLKRWSSFKLVNRHEKYEYIIPIVTNLSIENCLHDGDKVRLVGIVIGSQVRAYRIEVRAYHIEVKQNEGD